MQTVHLRDQLAGITAVVDDIIRRSKPRLAGRLGSDDAVHLVRRQAEVEILPLAEAEKIGVITYSPLGGGLLTGKYLAGVPADSRKAKGAASFRDNYVTDANLEKIRQLGAIAQRRGQTLAQMALAWVLRDPQVSSALIGASKISQLEENVAALANLSFSPEELAEIDLWAKDADLNIWAASSTAG